MDIIRAPDLNQLKDVYPLLCMNRRFDHLATHPSTGCTQSLYVLFPRPKQPGHVLVVFNSKRTNGIVDVHLD